MQDELGKMLFAATSGLIGVAGVARELHAEADAIWGQRASAKRAYTVAERALRDAEMRVRNGQTRPKEWDDARKQLEEKMAELAALEARRANLALSLQRIERLRRTGPAVRRRAVQLSELDAQAGVVVLSATEETNCRSALEALHLARSDVATGRRLVEELEAAAASLASDELVLSQALQIEQLTGQYAAVAKAARDRAGIEVELSGERVTQAELLESFSNDTPTQLPPRPAVNELRDLAQRYEKAETSRRSHQRHLNDLLERCTPLRENLADAELTPDLPRITAAVENARSLGADFDAQCAEQFHKAERAASDVATAFARLAPWSGSFDALSILAPIEAAEIDTVQQKLAQTQDRVKSAEEEMMRLDHGLAQLEMEFAELASGGQAISGAELDAARTMRDDQWRLLRGHLLEDTRPADPAAAAADLEHAVRTADALADRRFTLAEASGRLAGIESNRTKLTLSRAQARDNKERTVNEAAFSRRDWLQRLKEEGLPEIDPPRLRVWLAQRKETLALAETAADLKHLAQLTQDRRSQTCRSLAEWLPDADTTLMAPLLTKVDLMRKQGEARNQNFSAMRTRLRDYEDQASLVRRHVGDETASRDLASAEWNLRCTALGLDLTIQTAPPRLDLYEQLRARADTIADLERRLDGISRDAAQFKADVSALCVLVEVSDNRPPGELLDGLKQRLATARITAERLLSLNQQQDKRQRDITHAAARASTALDTLSVYLSRTGASDPDVLGGFIEASQQVRRLRTDLADSEREIILNGDGHPLLDLIEAWESKDGDQVASDARAMEEEREQINISISEVASEEGAARKAFNSFSGGAEAADAAADAPQARAEMDVLAEDYLLRRTQTIMLGWVIENTRRRRENPLLGRAGNLFSKLTLGNYSGLHIEHEDEKQKLMGVSRNGESMIGVDAMSEGTTDQLFLALRLAAIEHSVSRGTRLPFLADDLFVNFDEDRARAGLQVLAELARVTQVLFFTHHAHLIPIARDVVGADFTSTFVLEVS